MFIDVGYDLGLVGMGLLLKFGEGLGGGGAIPPLGWREAPGVRGCAAPRYRKTTCNILMTFKILIG